MAPDVKRLSPKTTKMSPNEENYITPGHRKMYALSLVILFLALTVTISPAMGSLSLKMKGISENLGKALSDVLDEGDIKFTEPNFNVTFISTNVFEMKGMAPLYNITKMIIDILHGNDAFPEDLIRVHAGNIEVTSVSNDWQLLMAHYAGVVAIAIISVAFVLFLPIVGFCFCCCRCAGACGARSQPFDKKHDRCKKVLLATLLICFVTLFMFGVVCAFVTNERVVQGTHEFPSTVRDGLTDTNTFIETTKAHIDVLLITNFEELRQRLISMLETSGSTVSEQLGEFSRAVSVTTLNTMVNSLDDVQADLKEVRKVTTDLRNKASQLNIGLRHVRNELLHTLINCNQTQCTEIMHKYKIGELDTSGIDFSQLPDVTELLQKVSALIDGNIQLEVQEGQKIFNDIKRNIEDAVNEQIPILEAVIENASQNVGEISRQINSSVQMLKESLVNRGTDAADVMQRNIDQYAIYLWYIDLGACCILLLVLTCMAMGLLCGICGKRPDGYGDDCCNKGAGSRFLMLGVAFMFLLGSVLCVVMLAHFLVGIATQRIICDTLNDPKENQVFGIVDDFVNLEYELFGENIDPTFTVSFVLLTCHRNKTAYEVFRLNRIVDLDSLRHKSAVELEARISQITDSIQFPDKHFVILKASAKEKLNELAESGLSDFPFDRFTEVLVTNITSIDLISLANSLKDTADKIADKAVYDIITSNLRNQAMLLETYQTNLVDSMVREVEKLNNTAIELRDGLKFTHPSFRDAVEFLVKETEEAEAYLSTQGPAAIKNLTQIFAETIGALVTSYMNRVVDGVANHAGHCAPLSNVYNATVTASCQRVLMPFNGFWVAIGWCILLFVPMIIMSVKLATLYQKSDPYPGPLVEASYGDGSKRGGRRRGGGGGSRGEVEGRGAGSTGVAGGTTAPGSAPPIDAHDPRRYHDMAPKNRNPYTMESYQNKSIPRAKTGKQRAGQSGQNNNKAKNTKHWEEGPPRYHGPTEYERPPPYYYPGPHDRQ